MRSTLFKYSNLELLVYSKVSNADIGPMMLFSRRAVQTLRHHSSTRLFSASATQNADFTHAVIGAGAVGLAIARRLQQVEGAQVVLIEKHGMVGSETSSRNSEVR